MIKLYLFSIVIWAIMIFGTAYLFEEKMKENGWCDVPKSKKNPLVVLFVMSAVPIVRVICFIAELMMVGMTREKFEELNKELDDESN